LRSEKPLEKLRNQWAKNYAHGRFVLTRTAEPQFGGHISLPNWGSAIRFGAKGTWAKN